MDVQALYDSGQFKKVIQLLTSDKTISPILAFSYQREGLWEKAMEVWNTLIQQNPMEASYYNERGVCKFQLRFKHAFQDFDKAIELEPENPYYYSCRAYIKDKTGDTEGAIADYQKAHDLDPEDAITLNNLGLAETKLGFTARARERFKYSDDLLGVKTIDSRMEPETEPIKSSIWSELKKMVSSKKGFTEFLKDAGWKK